MNIPDTARDDDRRQPDARTDTPRASLGDCLPVHRVNVLIR